MWVCLCICLFEYPPTPLHYKAMGNRGLRLKTVLEIKQKLKTTILKKTTTTRTPRKNIKQSRNFWAYFYLLCCLFYHPPIFGGWLVFPVRDILTAFSFLKLCNIMIFWFFFIYIYFLFIFCVFFVLLSKTNFFCSFRFLFEELSFSFVLFSSWICYIYIELFVCLLYVMYFMPGKSEHF